MYNRTTWIDHAVTPPNTVKIKDNDNGTFTLTEAGEVIQQGTNMSATNFNNMETGIAAGYMTATEAARALMLAFNHLTAHDTAFEEADARFQADETMTHFVNSTLLETVIAAKMAQEKAEALEGFVLTATLTNSQKYPFNNSIKTIALGNSNLRNTKDYTIIVEVESYTGGCVGNIVISDKMLNGFKVAHTGSATEVNLKIYVQGGV